MKTKKQRKQELRKQKKQQKKEKQKQLKTERKDRKQYNKTKDSSSTGNYKDWKDNLTSLNQDDFSSYETSNYEKLIRTIENFIQDYKDKFVGEFRDAYFTYQELLSLLNAFDEEKVNADKNFIPKALEVNFYGVSDWEINLDSLKLDYNDFLDVTQKIRNLYDKYLK